MTIRQQIDRHRGGEVCVGVLVAPLGRIWVPVTKAKAKWFVRKVEDLPSMPDQYKPDLLKQVAKITTTVEKGHLLLDVIWETEPK